MLFYDKFTEMIELNDQHPLGVSDRTKLKRRVANANRVVKGIRLIPVKKSIEGFFRIKEDPIYCYVCEVEHEDGICEKEAFNQITVTPNNPQGWVDPMGHPPVDGEEGDFIPENPDDNPPTGGTITMPDTEELFPGKTHDKILANALKNLEGLNEMYILLIQEGSRRADTFQGIQYNYIHSQRNPGEEIKDAVEKTRNFFTIEVTKFLKNKDYDALGMALHPIMDIYTPPHQLFSEFDGFLDYMKHFFEIVDFSYPKNQLSATDAVSFIYNQLLTLPTNATPDQIREVYNTWLYNYLK